MDYLIVIIFLSSHLLISLGQNENFTSSTTTTLVEPELLLNNVELINSTTTVSIINLENNSDDGILSYFKNFLKKFDTWLSKFFNRSYFILTIAFLIGFITLAVIILISICIYKNLCGKKRSNSQSKITTNPAYDKIPKVDFLDSTESLNKPKIYKESLKVNVESPDSKASNETIRLIDIKPDEVKEPHLVKAISNQSIKSFSSSSTSKNSVIEQTPMLSKSNIKSSISSLSKKLNSSNNLEKSALLADQESLDSKNRFTPNSKKSVNRQPNNIEGQISRRSLFNNRSNSESGAELPPVPPSTKQREQRESIASSIGSIANGQIAIDVSQIEQAVDNMLKEIKPYQQSSSSININKSSAHASLSDIYMQVIKEKREKEQQARIQRNKQIEASATSISMNPNGGAVQRNSVANLDNESIKTFGTEKSCY